ncbi:hypothetical protein [Alteromonas gracilis]|uniref:hypothetical protein n=1 Tax=Alteromonas gracilis TaxID=1479524 RepID=UPI0037366713
MTLRIKPTLLAFALLLVTGCASTEPHEPVLDFVKGAVDSHQKRQDRAAQQLAPKTDDKFTDGDAASGVLNVLVQGLNRWFDSKPE